MSPRGKASGPSKRPAWFSALGRFLSGGLEGESSSRSPEGPAEEAVLETEEKASEESEGTDRIIECPQCGAPAAIVDEGTTHAGVGFCGHEYVFKLLKIICARGHVFTALDETRSVHAPDVDCEYMNMQGA